MARNEEPKDTSRTGRETSRTAEDVRATATKVRGALAPFRMLSGGFRARVTEALGAAAALEEDRVAVTEDRDAIQSELRQYREALTRAHAEIERLGAQMTSALSRAISTESDVLAVQKRALSLDERTRKLDENETALRSLTDDVSRRQQQASDLLQRLGEEMRQNRVLREEVAKAVEAARQQVAALDARSARLAADEQALAARVREVSAAEGRLAAGAAQLAQDQERLAADRAHVTSETARLADLQSRLERDQAEQNEAHRRALAVEEGARAHEQQLEKHVQTLNARLQTQDATEAALAVRARELDERRLAHERERVALDAKIRNLADLDQRNEQLLRTKELLDAEDRRLHTELTGVRENQKRTADTWEDLKRTLAQVEALERRVQATNDQVEQLRAATERRDRELTEAAKARSLALDAREREILNWRMQAELRERKVQERYNELDKVEAQKQDVRRQIEELELEHAKRVGEFEKDQQRVARLWAERRAEAEKARELYERNTALLEKRLAEVVRREGEHAQRAEELAERTAQLAERERRLRTLEDRVRLLEEQRDSLNQVVTNLTTRIGREWPSPEARLESGLQPPPIDAPISAPGSGPGSSSGSSASGTPLPIGGPPESHGAT